MTPTRFLNALLLVLFMASASRAVTLSGTVQDGRGSPLAGATVAIPALHRGTVTDDAGAFQLPRLPVGKFTVEVSLLGFRRETRSVDPSAGDSVLHVTLFDSPLELAPITVTAAPQPVSVQSSTQSVTVVEGRHLDRHRGQAIMEAVKAEPGMALLTTGVVAKPVIRGLSSQRVLVVSDGIRQEGHQWGDEHGPELDALDVERIEVVRGPNSVLFGSDALGGVVNVVRPDIPVPGDAPLLAGTLYADGHSGNRQAAGALSVEGAAGPMGYRAHVTVREAGDVQTPAGALFNSGLRERNGSALIGVHRDWGTVELDYSRVWQEIELHENPAEGGEATPYQEVEHDRLHVHTNFLWSPARIEVNAGWQRNERQEFAEADAEDSEVHLRLASLTLDAKAHHRPLGRLMGTLGVSALSQTNKSLGEEELIPGYDLANVAGYLFEEFRAGALTLSAGGRMDGRTLDPELRGSDETRRQRSYSAVTGTVGGAWRLQRDLIWTASAGRGWRSPTAFELFAFGVHEGTQRFEMGDPELDPEGSLNVESGLRYHAPRLRADAAVYRNAIDRYIFPRPTGDVRDGHDVHRYAQADAVLTGMEFDFEWHAAKSLVVTGGADLVRGENLETGDPLPLVPADRVRLGLRIAAVRAAWITSPYINFESTLTVDQERIAPYETRTGGYALFDAGAGGTVHAGSMQMTVDVRVENLLNRAYASHLSRYKAYALDAGRNVILKAAIPFTIAR